MKNIDIIETYEGLNELIQDSSIKFPAKISFTIIHNLKILGSIVQEIEEAKMTIIKNYSEKGEDYKIPVDKVAVANKELADLANVEVEVPLMKIKMQDIENLNISLKIAAALSHMLEEEI